jgi:hypothetical protein
VSGWQAWVVAIVVPLAALHVAWALAGDAARRRLCAVLATAPLPAAWRGRLRRHAAPRGSCACSGCDGATSTPPRAAVVQVHRRPL